MIIPLIFAGSWLSRSLRSACCCSITSALSSFEPQKYTTIDRRRILVWGFRFEIKADLDLVAFAGEILCCDLSFFGLSIFLSFSYAFA